MSWQGAYQTNSLEEAMRGGNDSSQFSVLEKHADGRRWRRTLWAPVFHAHPEHGETFFNSILAYHGSWLDGHAYWSGVPTGDRALHCLFGDGTEFSGEELAEIRRAYDESAIHLHLEPGDVVVVVDNLRVSHGRTPYRGSRLLGVAISDSVNRGLCRPPAAFARL